jgi:hypothetical protein
LLTLVFLTQTDVFQRTQDEVVKKDPADTEKKFNNFFLEA